MDLFDRIAVASHDVVEELATLRSRIAEHQILYHGEDAPTISDEEFDGMVRRHDQIVRQHPELESADSPTNAVGSKPNGRLPRVKHEIPMLSLANAFDRQDVQDFVEGVARALCVDAATLLFTAEPKDDGLSCSLIYEGGRLVRATTRGDKEIGEDVTAQASTVTGLPRRLAEPHPERIEVRGEVYMTHTSFEAINARFAAEGRKPLANCRNGAAGALRQSDPAETARRPLDFFAYEIAHTSGEEPATQDAVDLELARLGFATNPLMRVCDDVDALCDHHLHVESVRAALGYDIDGMVYKLRSRALQKRLGTVSRTPRWAIAHKFAAQRVQTRLESIDVQVGRTGKLTPVARLSPVSVGGVVVTNATLHNEDYIAGKDLRIGDLVVVQRAGDVIPQIVGRADVAENRDDRPVFAFPQTCPVCGSHAERPPEEADRRCVAGLTCPAQRKEGLMHLASRKALDIDGLGSSAISEFVDAGLLREPADVFRLAGRRHEIVSMDGWGDSSCAKLLAAIEARRASPLDRTLYALNIRNVGETATRLLARRHGDLPTLLSFLDAISAERDVRRAKAEATGDWGANRNGPYDKARFEIELAKDCARRIDVEGIGPEIVSSLLDFLDDPTNRAMLDALDEEMDIRPVVFATVESVLTGKTVVFTGTLEHMTRDAAKAKAESLGAKVSGSVSAKTDLLIHGPGAGSKLAKAEALGVALMTEIDWMAMMAESEA